MEDIDTARATTFGGWAAQYHRWRPTYPDDAVRWLLPPHASRVAEVGAGTGKLTDRLVERGVDLDVVVVADAWHWFPKAEAAAEAARVLRPGGWLGTVWNLVASRTGSGSCTGSTRRGTRRVRGRRIRWRCSD